MAATLREHWPEADVSLTASGGGVFEVTLDEKLLFSKKRIGRHAQPGEVVGLIRTHLV